MVRHAAPRGSGKHCHCCRQKRPSSQLIPCGASQGEGGAKHGPWCHRCILTKLHKSALFISSATEAAREGVWKCPRCEDVCPCNKCIQRRSKDKPSRKTSGPNSESYENDAREADDGEDEHNLDIDDSFPSPTSNPRTNHNRLDAVQGVSAVWQQSKSEMGEMRTFMLPSSANTESYQTRERTLEGFKKEDASFAQAQQCCKEMQGDESFLSDSNEMLWMKKKSRWRGGKLGRQDSSDIPLSQEGESPHWRMSQGSRGEAESDPASVRNPMQCQLSLARGQELPRLTDPGCQQDAEVVRCNPEDAVGSSGSHHGKENNEKKLEQSFYADKEKRGAEISVKIDRQPMSLSVDKERDDCGSPSGSLLSPSTPSKRKFSRKGIPLRGDSGIELSSLWEQPSPRFFPSNQSRSSPQAKKSPPSQLGRDNSLMETFLWNSGRSNPARPHSGEDEYDLPGRQAKKNSHAQQQPSRLSGSEIKKESPEVSIERLEKSRKEIGENKFENDGQEESSSMEETQNTVSPPSAEAQALKKEFPHFQASPTRPNCLTRGQSTTLSEKDKSLAAAVAATLKICNAGGISYQSPSCSFSGSEACTQFVDSGDEDSEDSSAIRKHHRMRTLPSHSRKRSRPESLRERKRHVLNGTWVPPVSPYGLIQEKLYKDPWKLLVACMLLNKTAGQQMHKVIWNLFDFVGSPEAAVAARTEDIANMIHSLGLHKKRANMIQRFSVEYMRDDWADVSELHGIGKYASDAYTIFCEGRWREVIPNDHMLLKYWEWLHKTQGQGYGFTD